MTRRLVLTVTALAALAGGVGVASAATSSTAATTHVATTPASGPHQFCLLIWRDDTPDPQHICVNY
jgi:hypothetical protein